MTRVVVINGLRGDSRPTTVQNVLALSRYLATNEILNVNVCYDLNAGKKPTFVDPNVEGIEKGKSTTLIVERKISGANWESGFVCPLFVCDKWSVGQTFRCSELCAKFPFAIWAPANRCGRNERGIKCA